MLSNLGANKTCPWFQLQIEGNRKGILLLPVILRHVKGASFLHGWNTDDNPVAFCLFTQWMWFLTVLFSSHISYKWPSQFSHLSLLQMMVLLLYDGSRRLELVANKKTNPHRNVWLHCAGWDWTRLPNHLSVHLPLNANWVGAGARWTLLSVSSLKANSGWHSLSICAQSQSLFILESTTGRELAFF